MDNRSGKKPTTVVLEEMRIEEIETTDKKIKRTWSYVKKEALPKIPETEPSSLSAREKAESEVNLLKNNSYISRVSSPLAHRLKQQRIEKGERLHLN